MWCQCLSNSPGGGGILLESGLLSISLVRRFLHWEWVLNTQFLIANNQANQVAFYEPAVKLRHRRQNFFEFCIFSVWIHPNDGTNFLTMEQSFQQTLRPIYTWPWINPVLKKWKLGKQLFVPKLTAPDCIPGRKMVRKYRKRHRGQLCCTLSQQLDNNIKIYKCLYVCFGVWLLVVLWSFQDLTLHSNWHWIHLSFAAIISQYGRTTSISSTNNSGGWFCNFVSLIRHLLTYPWSWLFWMTQWNSKCEPGNRAFHWITKQIFLLSTKYKLRLLLWKEDHWVLCCLIFANTFGGGVSRTPYHVFALKFLCIFNLLEDIPHTSQRLHMSVFQLVTFPNCKRICKTKLVHSGGAFYITILWASNKFWNIGNCLSLLCSIGNISWPPFGMMPLSLLATDGLLKKLYIWRKKQVCMFTSWSFSTYTDSSLSPTMAWIIAPNLLGWSRIHQMCFHTRPDLSTNSRVSTSMDLGGLQVGTGLRCSIWAVAIFFPNLPVILQKHDLLWNAVVPGPRNLHMRWELPWLKFWTLFSKICCDWKMSNKFWPWSIKHLDLQCLTIWTMNSTRQTLLVSTIKLGFIVSCILPHTLFINFVFCRTKHYSHAFRRTKEIGANTARVPGTLANTIETPSRNQTSRHCTPGRTFACTFLSRGHPSFPSTSGRFYGITVVPNSVFGSCPHAWSNILLYIFSQAVSQPHVAHRYVDNRLLLIPRQHLQSGAIATFWNLAFYSAPMLLETVQGYEVLGFNIGPHQSTITFVQPLRSVQISGTSQAIRSGVVARSRLILTHVQTQIRHWEIAEGVSPPISFERSIALVEKYCPARGLCVCPVLTNRQWQVNC